MTLNTHQPMVDEILEQVNTYDVVSDGLKMAYMKYSYLQPYFHIMVSDVWPNVDVDTIEYKDYGYHRSMAGAMLLNRQTSNIFMSVIMDPKVDEKIQTKQIKGLMEMLYAGEAKILKAFLKKNITELYPNITFEAINKSLGVYRANNVT